MARPGYKTSNIPQDLAEPVLDAVRKHGYESFDSFVHEAIREKLKRLARRKK